MNRFISLTKVLLKNSFSTFGTGKATNTKTLIYVILIFISVIPIPVGIVTFTTKMVNLLYGTNQEGIVITLGFTSASLMTLVFSIFWVISVFYFAKDLDFLLPLPFKPSELVSAKFLVLMIYQYFIILLYTLPMIIGFSIETHPSIIFYIYSALILLLLPVIPSVLGSVLIMFFMRFVNLTHRKDQFRIAMAIVGIGVITGLNYLTSNYLNAQDPEKAMQLFRSGGNAFLNNTAKAFPSVKFAVLALVGYQQLSGFINILAYTGVNILFIGIFIRVSSFLYLKGAIGGSEVYSESRKISAKDINAAIRKNTIIKSYVVKELKILFRTPAYFLNCVIVNLVWPVIAVLVFKDRLGEITNLLKFGISPDVFAFASLAIGMFIAGSNGITASAISREGTSFSLNKYLPVKYEHQVISKLLSGVLISSPVVFLVIIALGIIIGLPIHLILLFCLISLVGVFFSSMTGLIMDLNFPKLIWDNEYKPVKQNLNVLFNLLINAGFAAGLIYLQLSMNLEFTGTLLVTVGVIAITFSFYQFLIINSGKLIEKIEV